MSWARQRPMTTRGPVCMLNTGLTGNVQRFQKGNHHPCPIAARRWTLDLRSVPHQTGEELRLSLPRFLWPARLRGG